MSDFIGLAFDALSVVLVCVLAAAALFAALVADVVEPLAPTEVEPSSASTDPVEPVAVDPDAVWTLQA
jgi:hypothetical protein